MIDHLHREGRNIRSFCALRRRCVKALLLPIGASSVPTRAASLETRQEKPAAFSGVRTDVPAEITIRIGKPVSVVMSAEPAVLDVLTVEVSAQTLTLRASGSFSTRERVRIEIQTPELRTLEIGGSASVRLESLQADRLQVRANGSASLTLDRLNLQLLSMKLEDSAEARCSGVASSQELATKGASSVDGLELASKDATVVAADASTASISVERRLKVVLTDAARVVYAGSPKIDDSVSDAASLNAQ